LAAEPCELGGVQPAASSCLAQLQQRPTRRVLPISEEGDHGELRGLGMGYGDMPHKLGVQLIQDGKLGLYVIVPSSKHTTTMEIHWFCGPKRPTFMVNFRINDGLLEGNS
jgi:hypothetical protein